MGEWSVCIFNFLRETENKEKWNPKLDFYSVTVTAKLQNKTKVKPTKNSRDHRQTLISHSSSLLPSTDEWNPVPVGITKTRRNLHFPTKFRISLLKRQQKWKILKWPNMEIGFYNRASRVWTSDSQKQATVLKSLSSWFSSLTRTNSEASVGRLLVVDTDDDGDPRGRSRSTWWSRIPPNSSTEFPPAGSISPEKWASSGDLGRWVAASSWIPDPIASAWERAWIANWRIENWDKNLVASTCRYRPLQPQTTFRRTEILLRRETRSSGAKYLLAAPSPPPPDRHASSQSKEGQRLRSPD